MKIHAYHAKPGCCNNMDMTELMSVIQVADMLAANVSCSGDIPDTNCDYTYCKEEQMLEIYSSGEKLIQFTAFFKEAGEIPKAKESLNQAIGQWEIPLPTVFEAPGFVTVSTPHEPEIGPEELRDVENFVNIFSLLVLQQSGETEIYEYPINSIKGQIERYTAHKFNNSLLLSLIGEGKITDGEIIETDYTFRYLPNERMFVVLNADECPIFATAIFTNKEEGAAAKDTLCELAGHGEIHVDPPDEMISPGMVLLILHSALETNVEEFDKARIYARFFAASVIKHELSRLHN